MYITSPKKTTFHLVSILISTMTTAFSSALVSYDQDVSAANRKKNPGYYGYVKDTNLERSSTFVVMMLLAAFHNLSRTIGTALLLAVSGTTTFVIMGAEMALYIGFKVLRNDFVLWIPGLEGALKYMAALIVHVVVKVLVDYTGERCSFSFPHGTFRSLNVFRLGTLSRAKAYGRLSLHILDYLQPGAALHRAFTLRREHQRDERSLDNTSLLLGRECCSVLRLN